MSGAIRESGQSALGAGQPMARPAFADFLDRAALLESQVRSNDDMPLCPAALRHLPACAALRQRRNAR